MQLKKLKRLRTFLLSFKVIMKVSHIQLLEFLINIKKQMDEINEKIDKLTEGKTDE
jgi:hypothetical protein